MNKNKKKSKCIFREIYFCTAEIKRDVEERKIQEMVQCAPWYSCLGTEFQENFQLNWLRFGNHDRDRILRQFMLDTECENIHVLVAGDRLL